jgi:subtilisin family serine protease
MSNGVHRCFRKLVSLMPVLFVALAVPACDDDSEPLGPATDRVAAPAPSLGAAARSGTIPGSYLVVFKSSVADAPGLARQLVGAHGGSLRFTYSSAIKGFAADLPDRAAAALQRNSSVSYVEPDATVELYGAGTEPSPPSWGLDRVDQRALPLSASYTWGTSGTGVHVYIIDTGIRTTHQDFGGRASWDFSSVKGKDAGIDCHGHGTHVAGTIGGTSYGVAKGVSLHAVKVLDCAGDGRWSGVIAAIDWVTANAMKPAVVNLSLGGLFNQTMNDAVAASVASGITYSVAAGNAATDACTFSPASEPTALTVGATFWTDAKAGYSNVGSCVDLFAPGSFINSDWNASDTATAQLSGTSMATPHVAGAAALYLETHSSASPAAVAAALVGTATQGRVTGLPTGTANLLLFVGDSAAAESPTGGGGSCLPNKPWSKNCK